MVSLLRERGSKGRGKARLAVGNGGGGGKGWDAGRRFMGSGSDRGVSLSGEGWLSHAQVEVFAQGLGEGGLGTAMLRRASSLASIVLDLAPRERSLHRK